MKQASRDTTHLYFEEDYYKKIAAVFDQLGGAEQKAAAYIADHGAACARMSISQLAENCGCSTASVVRLCKSLGYSGYAELKFNIQQSGFAAPKDNLSISQSDTPEVMVEKTFRFTQNSLNRMIQLLNTEDLERASKAIAHANAVLFCGMGSACGAALAGANHLLSAGINAYFQMDDLLQVRMASYCHVDDVVIGINYDCNAKNVADTLMVAKENGATTILITSIADGLCSHYADIILRTPKRYANNSLNYSTSTICQVMIVHLLLVGAWQWSGPSLQEKSEQMRALTYMKRYASDIEKVDIKTVKQ